VNRVDPDLTRMDPNVNPEEMPIDASGSPRVLIAGFTEDEERGLRALAQGNLALESACAAAAVERCVERRDVSVLCLGPLVAPDDARAQAARARPDSKGGPHVIVVGVGSHVADFQDLIDEDRLFYLSIGAMPVSALSDVIRSAIASWESRLEAVKRPSGLRHALQAARRVAALPDLVNAGELLRLAAEETVQAERVYCLLYNLSSKTLWWRATGLESESRRESPAVGLVSFVARTGHGVRLSGLVDDPRYERDADDPLGRAGHHYLAVPVLATDGGVLAVLSVVRDAHRPPFTRSEHEALELLATTVAPSLQCLELESRLDEEEALAERTRREGTSTVFREEALAAHATAGEREGDWLRLSPPRWIERTFWLLAAVAVAAAAYVCAGGNVPGVASHQPAEVSHDHGG
jgi:hypothetical protein